MCCPSAVSDILPGSLPMKTEGPISPVEGSNEVTLLPFAPALEGRVA
jgi:hypothetical protein